MPGGYAEPCNLRDTVPKEKEGLQEKREAIDM
jgi:hypothetical protein